MLEAEPDEGGEDDEGAGAEEDAGASGAGDSDALRDAWAALAEAAAELPQALLR